MLQWMKLIINNLYKTTKLKSETFYWPFYKDLPMRMQIQKHRENKKTYAWKYTHMPRLSRAINFSTPQTLLLHILVDNISFFAEGNRMKWTALYWGFYTYQTTNITSMIFVVFCLHFICTYVIQFWTNFLWLCEFCRRPPLYHADR